MSKRVEGLWILTGIYDGTAGIHKGKVKVVTTGQGFDIAMKANRSRSNYIKTEIVKYDTTLAHEWAAT